jgi:hypothetical protein
MPVEVSRKDPMAQFAAQVGDQAKLIEANAAALNSMLKEDKRVRAVVELGIALGVSIPDKDRQSDSIFIKQQGLPVAVTNNKRYVFQGNTPQELAEATFEPAVTNDGKLAYGTIKPQEQKGERAFLVIFPTNQGYENNFEMKKRGFFARRSDALTLGLASFSGSSSHVKEVSPEEVAARVNPTHIVTSVENTLNSLGRDNTLMADPKRLETAQKILRKNGIQ